MVTRHVIATFFTCSFLACSLANAQILDGSFESGEMGAGEDERYPWHGRGLATTSPHPREWPAKFPADYGFPPPTDGRRIAVLDTDFVVTSYDPWGHPLITQHVGSEAWQRYQARPGDIVSFDLAGRPNPVNPDDVFVEFYSSLGGTYTSDRLHFSSSEGDFTGQWKTYSYRVNSDAIYRTMSFVVLPESYARIAVDNVRLLAYGSLDNPILPTSTTPSEGQPIFNFVNVSSQQWFDPPTASGFVYTMTNGSLFNQILDFPPGFNNPFIITVGNELIGEFLPGQSVNFVDLLGIGVSSFKISGIAPLVDPEDPLGFPLKLDFNTPTASFTMQAVPEFGGLASISAGGMLLCLFIRHRRIVE